MARRTPNPHARVAAARVPTAQHRGPRAADEPRPSLAYRPGLDSRVARRRAERRRMFRRRRRTAVLTLLLAAAGLIGLDLARDRGLQIAPPFTIAGRATQTSPGAAPAQSAAPAPATPDPTSAAPAAPRTTPPAPSPTPPPSPTPQPVPATGAGDFSYAGAAGPVLGGGGPLRRFRVAVEGGMGVDPDAFAAAADRILGDPRSWIAGGDLRLQRVPRASAAEFTLYLASARTSERMCATGGLDTDGYTSCRLPGQVIVNATRWTEAVPGYGASLGEYQAYAVNHEVGHQLGYGHEACTGSGEVAPVMQQQTLGLQGCTANGWPYLDGRRVTGPAVP